MINVYLMVNMRMVTWIQYGIYMAIGTLIVLYLTYATFDDTSNV